MPEKLANLELAVEPFLAKEPIATPSRIRQLITEFRLIPSLSVTDDEAEQLARTFEARHSVVMRLGSLLTAKGYAPWLESARAGFAPYYWDRYRKLLASKHLSGQVIAMTDAVTDRILGLLENPTKDEDWDRRGMVVGHVQSGKTANYIGLICKAADAGYKVIVVIAGVHNNLRNQTQLRIDEGLIGRDSARLLSRSGEHFVGVGRIDATRRPMTFTNSLRDFNKATATSVGLALQNVTVPSVFVIKKNPKTLSNLLEWLKEHNAGGGAQTVPQPMLLIDDEADNASINIMHGQGAVSSINRLIRQLLQTFDRSCYVGYTATPFANIFIDPDTDDEMVGNDLFPRDFIVSLDPPSNYFGATKVFREESQMIVRHIKDFEDWLPLKHSITATVDSVPESLLNALRTFVVARAIRLARGHDHMHCSMLVNVTRFTNVQRQIRNEIHICLDKIQASVRTFGALSPERATSDPEIAALHATWEREYMGAGFTWPEVQAQLHAAASPIKVVEVNNNASGTLNYNEYESIGLNVVAVGGLSLSRGLTLEGLMISYFMRNSVMYDTLMQMGRWFGYRPEYEDLCRIWMPEDAEGSYAHVTESIEMLRWEFRRMEAAGAAPKEFGLKVRGHPDTLIVTARNKMGSGQSVVVSIGLGNNFIETAILRNDVASRTANLAAARRLSQELTKHGCSVAQAIWVTGGWLLQNAPVDPIMDFISAFQNHSESWFTDPGPVRQYIKERQDTELKRWDILFASVGPDNKRNLIRDESLGLNIWCQQRTRGKKSDNTTLRITNKQRVASRGVEKIGLTPEEVAAVEQEYREAEGRALSTKGTTNYPDHIYRSRRQNPLLIIHLLQILDPDDESNGARPVDNANEPVVAYSISFPRPEKEEKKVVYIVNTQWLREISQEEIDQEEIDRDDD